MASSSGVAAGRGVSAGFMTAGGAAGRRRRRSPRAGYAGRAGTLTVPPAAASGLTGAAEVHCSPSRSHRAAGQTARGIRRSRADGAAGIDTCQASTTSDSRVTLGL